MDIKWLAPLLTGSGSLLLAWRVKSILDSLILAQSGADTNFRSITAFLAGQNPQLPMLVGFDQHVARSQRCGVWLLVVGFGLIAAGGFLGAAIAYFHL